MRNNKEITWDQGGQFETAAAVTIGVIPIYDLYFKVLPYVFYPFR